MVGGYILQITPKRSGVSEIWVQGTGCEKYDECAVLVKDAPITLRRGRFNKNTNVIMATEE